MTHIRIEIELLEDLHTGSGVGFGGVDAALACDRDGWPVIRASHVRGVWADALRAVKPDAVDKLFGAARSIRGSLAMSSFYAVAEPDRLIWSSTAREQDSRKPQEDTLRSREYIAAGTHFTAQAWVPDGLEPDLMLAVARADAFGARRRRGDGVIRIVNWESKPFNEHARNNLNILSPHPNPLPEGEGTSCLSYFVHDPKDGSEGTHLRLLLQAVDPLSLPVTGVPGNIIPGECYMRGQQLGGAIAGALLRSGRDASARLWFNRAIRVHNAYPLPAPAPRSDADGSVPENWQNGRVWPIPLCYQRSKPGGAPGFPWWAVVPGSDAEPKPKPKKVDIIDRFNDTDKRSDDEKPKRPGDRDFLFQESQGQSWQYYAAPLALRMRNAVPRENNIKGSLFTQEEIPERTRFIADIYFPDNETAQQCAESLQPFLGTACLEVGRGGAPLLIEAAAWSSASSNNSGKVTSEYEAQGKLEMLLTSDLIARDDTLAFLETLNTAALAGLCGLNQESVKDVSTAAYADKVEIHGFNALTGLPRMPALAIRRGSAFCFKGPGSQIDALRKALEAHIDKGLGERRCEGFGSFVLDFRDEANSKQIFHVARANVEPEDNPLETAIGYAEKVWDELNHLDFRKPALVHWQRWRATAMLGEKELSKRLEQFLKDCDKLGKSDSGAFATWLKGKLEILPEDVDCSLFYRQLLRLYVIHLGKQGEQE